MRLTLRTLLAYLDDILEPQDAKELSEKIEDSEFASGLVHRIRSSIGRVRLSSPQVLGHGVGVDPNSVAEYLDNTLPPDRFPEFEKVCLESDAHLSEVASCHQVLALVLGEPSQFESSLRDRMYQLPQTGRPLATADAAEPLREGTTIEEVSAAGSVGTAGSVGSGTEAEGVGPANTSAERSVKSSWLWPAAAAMVVGLLATWGILRALGPLDSDHPLARALGMMPTAEDANEEFVPLEVIPGQAVIDTASSPPSGVVSEGLEVSGSEGSFSPETSLAGDDVSNAALTPQGATPEPDGRTESDTMLSPNERLSPDEGVPPEAATGPWDSPAEPVVTQPLEVAPSPPPLAVTASGGDADHPIASVDISVPEWPGVKAVESESGDPSGTAGMAEPGGTLTAPVAPDALAPDRGAPQDLLTDGADDGRVIGKATEDDGNSEIAPRLQNVGRFISDHEVLVIADEAASWLRLRPRSSLNVGDHLVALPTYRPKILLATDLQMTIEGGTSLSVVEPFDGRTLTIKLHHGRAVLIPVGRDTPALGLAFGDRVGTVMFADPDSELAIEVQHERLPGADPQRSAHVVVRMWTISGRVQWKGADDASAKTLEAGQLYLFVDDEPGHFLHASVPQWAGERRRNDSMAMASRSLEPKMQVERPITLALAEAVAHRRVEVRALAARCLSYLDRFEPLIRTLNDPDQRAWWTYQIEALHEALARSPAVADRVSQDLVKARGVRGAELYRLLWGYSPEDLQAGADEQLIQYLESEELDFRVLGFDNLQRISGAHLMYQPWYTTARRRGSVAKWRKRLADGLVVYRSRPTVAVELESVR